MKNGKIIIFGLLLFMKYVSANMYTPEEINATCKGSASCCESGYNVMCHMADPIKNYRVTDVVCGNRGDGVYHKGMDLTKGTGDGNIYAVFDGKIIATTNNTKNCAPGESLMCSPVTCPSSRGVSVTLEVTDSRFAGYQVHYMHMSSKTVKVGDIVKQGQLLGKIGNTGCSTGTHLHFQINNYAGDAVNMNAYFLDKSLYACGGIYDNMEYEQFLTISEISKLLTNQNGIKYNATINNCVGALNQGFYQGIELYANNNKDVVNVNTVQTGYYIDSASPDCYNGVGILSINGEIHLYCNLENRKAYAIGQKIYANTNIGQMRTENNNKKFEFVVIRNGKFIDLSAEFLSVYGGTCKNSRRVSCSQIKNALEKIQCQTSF